MGTNSTKVNPLFCGFKNILAQTFPKVCQEAVKLYGTLWTFIRSTHLNKCATEAIRNKWQNDQKMSKWIKSSKYKYKVI